MNKKIKIAFIIDSIETPTAGTEKQLLMLLNGISRDMFEPYLVCLYESDWMKKQTFSFPVKCFAFGSFASFGFVGNLRRMIGFFKREEFDIVQTFFKEGNIIGTTAARVASVRMIVSSRRNIGYEFGSIQLAVLRFLRMWTSYYLANSRAVADKTVADESANPSKIKVIYNGLDLDKFRTDLTEMRKQKRTEWGINENEILIGTVANLRPVKNVDHFIETASVLSKEYNNLKFIAVGEGPERDKYQNLIDKINLRDFFFLPGSNSDILPCLAAFDIAVMCSRSESFSNSLIEYMAVGLPIAASDVGGNTEAIKHGVSGLIYSLSDKDGLLSCLGTLLSDQQLARKLGENAKKDAYEKYSIDKCFQETEKFYMDILGRNLI